MTDRWESLPIQCKGGLILDTDALTQGTTMPGSAKILQNFEPAIEGGYRRLTGFSKYDSAAVPGTSNEPVTGVKVAFAGVFATRKLLTDNAIYYSTGSGWGSPLNGTARTGTVNKARFISYSITKPVIVQVDGNNYAWKWDGASETLLNGAGAPSNPKYAAMVLNRLALSGYGDGSKLTLSAPNNDADYAAANGAAEINVGDTVVGLKTFRETLYLFCRRGIKKLVGTSLSDFQIVNVSESIGCLSGDTITEVGGDLVFLSPSGFRSLAGTEKVDDIELGSLSTPIQPLIRTTISSNFSENVYSSLTIRNKNQYRCFLNNPNSTTTDNIGFLARVTDTPLQPHGIYEWAVLRGIKPYCADSDLISNQEIAVIGHPTSGYVHKLETGNTFDGTNIEAIYRSPDITFEDATIRKVFQKINIYTQVEGNFEVLLNLKLDGENTAVLQPNGQILNQTGAAALYGTAVYGTDTYGEFTYPVFYRNLVGSGFTGAFLFSCANDKAPFRIDSFQVQYSVKGRR